MVKTFEELNENFLDEKKFNTLFAIYSRYIMDSYKQFNWKSELNSSHNKGELRCEYRLGEYNELTLILAYRFYARELKASVGYGGSSRGGYSFKEQSFPITSTKPKDLGKLAQNIFKWNKSIIDKL